MIERCVNAVRVEETVDRSRRTIVRLSDDLSLVVDVQKAGVCAQRTINSCVDAILIQKTVLNVSATISGSVPSDDLTLVVQAPHTGVVDAAADITQWIYEERVGPVAIEEPV